MRPSIRRLSPTRPRATFVAALAVILLSAGPCTSWAQSPGSPPDASSGLPMPVVTAMAAPRDVPIYLKGIGTVVASKSGVIRSRIEGRLTEIDFTEGQKVEVGDLLARLDPRTYQARLDQLIENRDRDQARLADALANAPRLPALASYRKDAPSQKAAVEPLEAIVKTDEALVEQARVDLGYTELRSPISGVMGTRLREVGDIISPTDANGVGIVRKIEPISVVFTLPQMMLPEIRRRAMDGAVHVLAYSQDGQRLLSRGTLLRVDDEQQPATGSAPLQATFPNKDHALRPGMLVEVRLRGNEERQALTIPAAAVQPSASGHFAYLVTKSRTAHVRPITLGTVTDGVAVVQEGLVAGDVVVTDGQYQLDEGTPLAIIEGPPAPRKAP